ncbi:MAG: substrate-binding domain-containing protein [Erysipelotrichaceae bacterium]|nr:substrate-binding domain-containing protein [Erysipelotrichaceae bacterium]
MSTAAFAGCASGSSASQNSPASSSGSSDQIHVITREEGSGTQSAFLELFGIESVLSDAEISNSTSVVMTTVANDVSAIGYISLGSLNDTVKALSIDGTKAAAENVKNGSYSVKRPFLIVFKEENNPLITDFVNFIHSSDGAAVIAEKGYVAQEDKGAFKSSDPEGSLTIGGSSSVTPLMEKLAEAYMKVNPKAKLSVMQSDSTVGISNAADGTYQIGMASRELKTDEKNSGLKEDIIAQDGIAVIVNLSNPVDNASKQTIADIYTGKIRTWNDVK